MNCRPVRAVNYRKYLSCWSLIPTALDTSARRSLGTMNAIIFVPSWQRTSVGFTWCMCWQVRDVSDSLRRRRNRRRCGWLRGCSRAHLSRITMHFVRETKRPDFRSEFWQQRYAALWFRRRFEQSRAGLLATVCQLEPRVLQAVQHTI